MSIDRVPRVRRGISGWCDVSVIASRDIRGWLSLIELSFRIVKLRKNWRSHAAILQFPNERFYGGDLECCADSAITSSMLRSDIIVKPNFPIVFHAIAGKDDREASSPSFFNIGEISLIKKYVNDLVSDQRLRLGMCLCSLLRTGIVDSTVAH